MTSKLSQNDTITGLNQSLLNLIFWLKVQRYNQGILISIVFKFIMDCIHRDFFIITIPMKYLIFNIWILPQFFHRMLWLHHVLWLKPLKLWFDRSTIIINKVNFRWWIQMPNWKIAIIIFKLVKLTKIQFFYIRWSCLHLLRGKFSNHTFGL